MGWDFELSKLMPVLRVAAPTLVRLDLSVNRLRGEIPKEFDSFASLAHLNLAENNLEGACARLYVQTYTQQL